MPMRSTSTRRTPRWLTTLLALTGLNAYGQSWSPQQPIEVDNGDVNSFDLAVAPNGDAVAAWSQSDGVRLNIWASNFSATRASWNAPQLIETQNFGDAKFPRVAIAANGSAAVVWQQGDGLKTHVWGNRFFPNTGWASEARIQGRTQAGFLTDAFAPRVALGPQGFAIAVWEQRDSEVFNAPFSIYAALSIGEQWSAPHLVEHSTAFAHSPSAAINKYDNAVVVWDQGHVGEKSIYSSHYEWHSHSWEAPELVARGAKYATRPEIVMNPSGAAIVTYHRQTDIDFPDNTPSLWAAAFQDFILGGGTWRPENRVSDASSSVAPQVRSSINSVGDAYVAWTDQSGVRSNRYAANVWGIPLRLPTTTGNTSSPAITIDPSGRAIAVWMQRANVSSNFDLRAASFTPPATSWSNSQLVESDSGSSFNPQAGSDVSGNVLAVWIQFDGVRSNLLWSRFTRAR